jgi:hypothetical protein
MEKNTVSPLLAGNLTELFGKLAVLLKSGDQRNTTCHSGEYRGMELYTTFRVQTS